MEGHCSTGQSLQWAVVRLEEEEEFVPTASAPASPHFDEIVSVRRERTEKLLCVTETETGSAFTVYVTTLQSVTAVLLLP